MLALNNNSNSTIKGELELKNIRKRTDGRWEARITINNKRISIYAKTQKECLKKYNAVKRPNYSTEKKPNFYEFALNWLNTYKKASLDKKTFDVYKVVINNHLNLNVNIKNINVEYLQDIINKLPATRIREITFNILKQILKKLWELEYTNKNLGNFLVKGKINRKKVEWFNLNEQQLIISNIDKLQPYDKARVLTMLLTGIRPIELDCIKKENCKNGFIFVNGTKSSNAKRWIKVSENLLNELNKLDESKFLKCDIKKFRTRFTKFLTNLNIHNKSLYSLRHTFATNLFYIGVPDKERQSYMGHFSSTLTNDVYTDFDPTVNKNDILNLYKDLYPKF